MEVVKYGFGYWKKYIPLAIIAQLCSFLAIICDLMIPLLSQLLIDYIIRNEKKEAEGIFAFLLSGKYGEPRTFELFFSIAIWFGGFILVKVILNYVCITVFRMTVAGVGIATITSNVVMSALAFCALLKNEQQTKFKWSRLKFYASELKSMLFIGIPTGLQTALYSFANTVIVTAVNGFGPDATTGVSIANQFDGILYQISCATSLAAMPYVAQNIGARNFDRTKKTIMYAILITIMFGAGFGSLSAIFSRQLSSLMSSTPAVIEYSCQKMIIISSTYFICGINEVMGGALRGMGKPIIPTIATLVFMCLIRFVWVYCVFPLFPTLTFLYLIWPIGWILSISTQAIAYFITMPKLQSKQVNI